MSQKIEKKIKIEKYILKKNLKNLKFNAKLKIYILFMIIVCNIVTLQELVNHHDVIIVTLQNLDPRVNHHDPLVNQS
jgi:hypothetical protein